MCSRGSIDAGSDAITIRLAPEHTSTMDVGYRGSAVAVGAALFNAKVAAAAHRVLGPVTITEGASGVPLQATLQLRDATDPQLAGLYDAMLAREANRRLGTAEPIPGDTVQLLHATAEREGARLHLVTESDEISRAATILAESDRARYLTPKLHAEMIAELRWPGDPHPDTGIDIRSLEFEPGELAVVDILRRPEVMANLARWNAGSALGEGTRRQVAASSALAVISVPGGSLTDYARGGSAVEAVWITAQQRGLAVQPDVANLPVCPGYGRLHRSVNCVCRRAARPAGRVRPTGRFASRRCYRSGAENCRQRARFGPQPDAISAALIYGSAHRDYRI